MSDIKLKCGDIIMIAQNAKRYNLEKDSLHTIVSKCAENYAGHGLTYDSYYIETLDSNANRIYVDVRDMEIVRIYEEGTPLYKLGDEVEVRYTSEGSLLGLSKGTKLTINGIYSFKGNTSKAESYLGLDDVGNEWIVREDRIKLISVKSGNYKIHDTVKILKDSNCHGLNIGSVHKIANYGLKFINIDDNYFFTYFIKNGKKFVHVKESDIKLYKSKYHVQDKIRILSDTPNLDGSVHGFPIGSIQSLADNGVATTDGIKHFFSYYIIRGNTYVAINDFDFELAEPKFKAGDKIEIVKAGSHGLPVTESYVLKSEGRLINGPLGYEFEYLVAWGLSVMESEIGYPKKSNQKTIVKFKKGNKVKVITDRLYKQGATNIKKGTILEVEGTGSYEDENNYSVYVFGDKSYYTSFCVKSTDLELFSEEEPNKYVEAGKSFNDLLEESKKTETPVITSIQVKKKHIEVEELKIKKRLLI